MSDQSPRFSFIQVGEPGGQQLHESGFPEIRVIAQELFDGLDVFGHLSLASVIAVMPLGKIIFGRVLHSGGNWITSCESKRR